jgi:hypothetical protein
MVRAKTTPAKMTHGLTLRPRQARAQQLLAQVDRHLARLPIPMTKTRFVLLALAEKLARDEAAAAKTA